MRSRWRAALTLSSARLARRTVLTRLISTKNNLIAASNPAARQLRPGPERAFVGVARKRGDSLPPTSIMSKIVSPVCLLLLLCVQTLDGVVIPGEQLIGPVKQADAKAMRLVAKVLPELEEKSGSEWTRVIPIAYQTIKTHEASDYFIKVYAFKLSAVGISDVYMVLQVRQTSEQPEPKLVSFARVQPWDQLADPSAVDRPPTDHHQKPDY